MVESARTLTIYFIQHSPWVDVNDNIQQRTKAETCVHETE